MNARNKVPVSVIIVSFNTEAFTKCALNALYQSSVLPKQVIVVDNNSTDGTVAMIRKEFPQVTLMCNQENLGFARANNQALKVADQQFVWLLNSDTEVGESSLEQLYVYINTHNDVGVVGPQLVYADQRLQSVGGFFPTVMNVFLYLFPIHNSLPLRVRKNFKTIACAPQQIPPEGLLLDYVTGAALLVRKQALDNVGGLGEEYFMYFEETDLCWRLHMHGWKIKVISTQPVVHIYGGSYKHARDKKRLGMFLQSLKIFIKKNYTGWKKNSMLAEIFLGGHFSIFLKTLR